MMGRHRNVIRLYDVVEPTNDPENFQDLYYIFEALRSDLLSMMSLGAKITEYHVQTIMYHVLCGLNFIHSAGVIHRDLKPANILVNDDCTAKICDFGLSRQTKDLIDPLQVCGAESTQYFKDYQSYTIDSNPATKNHLKQLD